MSWRVTNKCLYTRILRVQPFLSLSYLYEILSVASPTRTYIISSIYIQTWNIDVCLFNCEIMSLV